MATHGRALLAKDERTGMIEADMREVEKIVDNPITRKLIDFTQPVGVLFIASLHFLHDEDAFRVVRFFRERMVPGSHLVISHGTQGRLPDDKMKPVQSVYDKATAPLVTRGPEEIARFFEGFEVVEPGLGDVVDWRNDPAKIRHSRGGYLFGGVARLR